MRTGTLVLDSHAQPMTEQRVRELYHETIEPLYRFVSRRCGGDRATAEDITQETWVRAVRAWRTDGIPESPIAWLTAVARNLLHNHLRRRPFLPLEAAPAERVAAPAIALDEDDEAERTELAAAVNGALARLPAGQSVLLTEYHFERRRVAELALARGISERAVEGRLRRARLNLRRLLEKVLPKEEKP
jgi:RNA polymerase sigma-70 factor, ECF subfamily